MPIEINKLKMYSDGTLADLAAGFRGGGNLVRGPNLGYPKTENSTDLTNLFWGDGPKFTFNEKFYGAFGEGAKDIMAPFLGLGGMAGLPPRSASAMVTPILHLTLMPVKPVIWISQDTVTSFPQCT